MIEYNINQCVSRFMKVLHALHGANSKGAKLFLEMIRTANCR